MSKILTKIHIKVSNNNNENRSLKTLKYIDLSDKKNIKFPIVQK